MLSMRRHVLDAFPRYSNAGERKLAFQGATLYALGQRERFKVPAGEAAKVPVDDLEMKLIFSEQTVDYAHYQFGYAIWAIPEAGETPADIFSAGFLCPLSRQLDRFYLCRQIRVNLERFELSSENRRVLRKGEDIEVNLVPARAI